MFIILSLRNQFCNKERLEHSQNNTGMRKTRRQQLVEHNSSKLFRRIIIECKLVE